MIVIGADTHKRTHALAAVDAGTGEVRGEREIAADDAGHRQALRWAQEIDREVVWALEDCRHVSHHLERCLVTAGERVVRVTPRLMGESRRGERQAGKSDQIDARAVARAVLREGVQKFPSAHLDEDAMEIRLLCDHREDQVAEINRLTNRLRWNLVILDPALEASIPPRKMDFLGQLDRVARRVRKMESSARVRIAKEQVKAIRELSRHSRQLKRELHALIAAHSPHLLAELGCSTITAAILIGQTAGAERFPTDAHFARMAGVAPIPASSGKTDRHRLHRGGNRRINRALHVIAITRGRWDPATKAYLERKEAEGKSRMEALRCLKRQLARHFHRLLLRSPTAEKARPAAIGAAPTPMRCLT
jgi:transposase